MNVGFVGLPDEHLWDQFGDWNALDGLGIAAAADADPARRDKVSKNLHIPRLYSSWQEMLGKEDIHFLHISIHGRDRTQLVENAATRGIHCLLEPPLAHSLESAVRMLDASRNNRVCVLVNWSSLRNPAMIHAARLVEQGDIGALVQIERRVVRAGRPPALPERTPESFIRSAPVLLQTCAEGANLCRTLIGLPASCTAVGAVHRPIVRAAYSPRRPRRVASATDPLLIEPLPPAGSAAGSDKDSSPPADANALDWQGALDELKRQRETPAPRPAYPPVGPEDDPPFDHVLTILSYGSASGLLEGSWRDAGAENAPDAVIRGELGSLLIRGAQLLRMQPGAAGETEIPVPPLPEDQQTGPQQLLWAALQEQEIEGFGSLQGSRDTQEILEAAILSAEEGRTVRLPLR